jgi:hypothetical protein
MATMGDVVALVSGREGPARPGWPAAARGHTRGPRWGQLRPRPRTVAWDARAAVALLDLEQAHAHEG